MVQNHAQRVTGYTQLKDSGGLGLRLFTGGTQMNVPETIYQQLGGQRFAALTGTRKLVGYTNGLTMTLAKNESGANRLAITLTPNDTYVMRFFKYSPYSETMTEIELFEDVYCDQLQDLFEHVTGFDLSLCRVYFC